MFEKNKLYKFEYNERFFYTGYVIEEDNIFVKVKTTKDETYILKKYSITNAWEVKENGRS